MPALWISAVVLFLALCLVGLGGVVHTTGSSLACPDWPLCNGEWLPAMRGGVEYEHSHRLLALAVAAGVTALPFVIPRARRGLRRLGLVALALVVVQALLGAATVILRLPPPVSIAHLLTATALVGLLGAITLGLREPPRLPGGAALSGAVDRAILALLVQIGLGAMVRHLVAMYACGDDPFGCAAALDGSPAAVLQVLHRVMGWVVAAFVVWLVVVAQRDAAATSATRWAARVPLVLVAVQIALGMAAIAWVMPIVLVTAHLVCAELLFLSLIVLRLRVGAAHAGAPSWSSAAPSSPPLAS